MQLKLLTLFIDSSKNGCMLVPLWKEDADMTITSAKKGVFFPQKKFYLKLIWQVLTTDIASSSW